MLEAVEVTTDLSGHLKKYFGFSKFSISGKAQTRICTPNYAAPELIRGLEY